MILFLIFLIIFAVAVYFALKILLVKIIAKLLKGKLTTNRQKGLLSFSSISFDNDFISFSADEWNLKINPIGLFTIKHKLLQFYVKSLDFKILKIPKKTQNNSNVAKKKEKTKSSIFLSKAIASLAVYFLRLIDVNISAIKLQFLNFLVNCSFHIHYERMDEAHLKLTIGETTVTKDSKKLAGVQQFDLSLSSDLNVIYSFLFDPKILLFKANNEKLVIETTKESLCVNEVELKTSFYPGDVIIKTTPIKISVPLTLPVATISLNNLDVKVQIPLKEIPYLQIHKIGAHFDELNIKIISEHFLRITSFDASIIDFKEFSFDGSVGRLSLHYSTLDGVELFPLVKQLRKPVWTPIRIKFAFPNGNANIKELKIKLIMTDLAIVHARSSDIRYSDKALIFPLVRVTSNKHPLGKLINFSISSPDEEFLTFSADLLKARDRHIIAIGWFIRNIIYGWYIIKPWASGHKYDTETLPIPIQVVVKRLIVEIDDTSLNHKLMALSRNANEFLKEKACLHYIFVSKLQQAVLSEKQIELANKKLEELYFNNYRIKTSKLKYHKYFIRLDASDVIAKLDSRNLGPGMEDLLYKFDPTTAKYHPNTKWDTLEGLRINAHIGSVNAHVLAIEKPFIQGSNVNVEGTLLLAEIEGKKIPIKTTVLGKEFTVPGNVTDIKIYSDLSTVIGSFEWYFGGPTLKIFDELSDAITAIIPENTLDPSPKLRWWDMLRSLIRGRYSASASVIITHLIGGTIIDNIDDDSIVIVKGAHVQVTEGLIKATTTCVDMTRCANGPLILHLPNFSLDWEIEWKNNSDNPHKHLVVPDISRFDDPEYDTYADFRATEYTWNFSFNFTHDKITSPFISFDIAHLLYIYDPIKNLYNGSRLNDVYKKKIYVHKKERVAKLYEFGKVPSIMTFKINKGPMLSFRVFDHFPVKNSSINGTSIDGTFIDFQAFMHLDLRTYGESKITMEISSETLQFNCTDLKVYSRFSSELSPTFCELKELKFGLKDDKIDIDLDSIRVAANQFNIKYIKEYIEAVFHFMPNMDDVLAALIKPSPNTQQTKQVEKIVEVKPDKQENNQQQENIESDFLSQLILRKTAEKIITTQRAKENRAISQLNKSFLDDFSIEVATITIPSIEILIESMQYDARVLCLFSGILMKFNKNEKSLYYCQLNSDLFTICQNGVFDINGSRDNSDEIIKIQGIKFQFYQKLKDSATENHVAANSAFISLNISGHDIALVKHLIEELQPPDNKANTSKAVKRSPSKQDLNQNSSFNIIELSVDQCQGFIKDSADVSIGSINISEVNFKSEMSGGLNEIAILIQDLKIDDIRPGALIPEVVSRWTSQVEANLNSPILRFQAKTSPPVGGVPIINHLEINLDPTKVNYEASFFSVLISLVLSKEVQKPIFNSMSDCFLKPGIYLPRVQVNKSSLPIIEEDTSKYMAETKSKEIKLRTDKHDEHMLLRYFKITSTKLNVSYHNAESKIPDVNEFNGLFHEIRYQDFNATMETLIGRLISDISLDMIPQFLKHMIGLGKIHESEEATLNMWLQNDHDKQSDRQKLMLFGKTKKGK